MTHKQINRWIASKACQVMKARRMKRRDLAIKMGCTPSYVTKLLRGRENLTIETCLKLASALGMSLQVNLK